MRALVVRQHGPLDSLRLETLPDPRPGPDDVLVDVHAASVNFPDLLVIGGTYQNLPPTPFVPGKDLAGTVAAVGANASAFKPGDRVFHDKFGAGTVERVEGDKLTVSFDRSDTKKIVAAFVKAA